MGEISAAPVLRFDTIASTNAEAMRRAAAGETGPLWIMADRQTAGRGRSGRAWASPTGNLAATLLFAPTVPPERVGELAIVLGVAAHRAVAELLAESEQAALRVKWPNDIMIGGAKLAGILVETSMTGGRAIACAGIGLNLTTPPDLAGTRPVTALASHMDAQRVPAADALRARIAIQLDSLLVSWAASDGFASIRRAWLAAAHPEGSAMSINTGGERVNGRFHGLSPEGALLLEDETGTVRRFTFGDVAV